MLKVCVLFGCGVWVFLLDQKGKRCFFLVFGMETGENIMVILAPRNYGGHKSPQMSLVVPRCHCRELTIASLVEDTPKQNPI